MDAISSFLESFRRELARVPFGSELESSRLVEKPTVRADELNPASSSYDWTPFIRRIRSMEANHDFLSVKWLRETRFSKNREMQEALEIAIDRGMLLTHSIDNPHNPEYPTTCCRLNRENEVVREILENIEKKS